MSHTRAEDLPGQVSAVGAAILMQNFLSDMLHAPAVTKKISFSESMVP